ncbi:glycoside hydrolase [Streptomyces sp. KR80]
MYGSPSDHNHISLNQGVLTLQTTRISWDEGNSSSPPYLPIRYHSGAVHAKNQIVVTNQFPQYEVKGEFQAPSTRGTWPAFWLTGVNSWPPECARHPGVQGQHQQLVQHLPDGLGPVDHHRPGFPSPGSSHRYRAWLTKVNDRDVDIHYYLDDAWKAVHRAAGWVGKPLRLIVNLQMEGSSGSPGPDGATYYRTRDVYVGRSRAS